MLNRDQGHQDGPRIPGVHEAALGDMSCRAVRLTDENILMNGMAYRVRVRRMEANLLLSLHERATTGARCSSDGGIEQRSTRSNLSIW